jgi:hypothetical protein
MYREKQQLSTIAVSSYVYPTPYSEILEENSRVWEGL